MLYSVTFFRKSHRLADYVEKHAGDRGATNDVTIWRIRIAYWIIKVTGNNLLTGKLIETGKVLRF